MRAVTVVAEDRVGLMADISYVLAKSHINIQSLHVDVVGEKAIIAMSVKDPKHARDILQKNGFSIISEPIVVKLPNVPGEMNRLTNRLHDEKVVIEDVHIVSTDVQGGVFALHVDKPRKAGRLLNEIMIRPDNAIF